MKHALVALLLFLSSAAFAADYNPARAKFHYQLYCQGCHTPDGSGHKSIPHMKDHVGVFQRSQRGREYLVRVPGSATSALNDTQLAEVLNYIVFEFSGESLERERFSPYSAAEVGLLRANPLLETVNYRADLLVEISRATGGTQ